MPAASLFEQVIEAHGGRHRWASVEAIHASLSSGGLAFTSRMQPFALRNLKLTLRPQVPEVTLENYVHPGWRGIWTPSQVRIVDELGRQVALRVQPRLQFPRLIKQVRWDKLDMLYFAGYALWNYLSFPFILDWPGIVVTSEVSPTSNMAGLLNARFADFVPTHSEHQTFHIRQDGLLERHDYTAEVIGGWATAANCCLASESVDGLRFYTRRRVTPRFGLHTVLPRPVLVWIEIDDLQLVHAVPKSSVEGLP